MPSNPVFTQAQQTALEAFGDAYAHLKRIEQAVSEGNGVSFLHAQAIGAMQAAASAVRQVFAAPEAPVPSVDALTGLDRTERPFAFSGGTVPLPALHDPDSGEWFYSPEGADTRYNLTHRLERPTVPITPVQFEMLYQIQGCADAEEGSYHDPVTDSLILLLARAAGVGRAEATP